MPIKFAKAVSTKSLVDEASGSPDAIENLAASNIREGILSKKSRRGKWQDRYFVLRSILAEGKDTGRAQLVYFKNEEEAKDEDVDVAACLDVSKLHEVVLSKNAVLLKGEKGLSYALKATDDATAKSWAEEFQTFDPFQKAYVNGLR